MLFNVHHYPSLTATHKPTLADTACNRHMFGDAIMLNEIHEVNPVWIKVANNDSSSRIMATQMGTTQPHALILMGPPLLLKSKTYYSISSFAPCQLNLCHSTVWLWIQDCWSTLQYKLGQPKPVLLWLEINYPGIQRQWTGRVLEILPSLWTPRVVHSLFHFLKYWYLKSSIWPSQLKKYKRHHVKCLTS